MSKSGPRPPLRNRRIIAGLAVAAIAAGGTLVAVGLNEPAAKQTWNDAVPVAVSRPGNGNGSTTSSTGSSTSGKANIGGVRLAAYDSGAGTALLATASAEKTTTVRTGDVIASPPSKAAPHGALFTVDKVTPADDGVKVTTKPATLSDALGAVEVDHTAEAPDIDMSVTPLAAGVTPTAKVPDLTGTVAGTGIRTGTVNPTPSEKPTATPSSSAPARQPTAPTSSSAAPASSAATSASPSASASASASSSAAPTVTIPGISINGTTILNPTRTADGGLLLSVNIPLDGVKGVTATSKGGPTLAGWVGLTPKIIFSYGQKDVDGAKPFQAEIGVGGKYTYGWKVHAALDGLADTGEQAIELPFATVHLAQTFFVGPVPIVLSVDLTYFYRITSDGNLSIDAEQSTTGEFAVGGSYDSRTGWGPLNRNKASTEGDPTPALTGNGALRATIGADLTVLLYDSAGVVGRLAPYLRAAVDADGTPTLWGLYAGFDLTSALTLQLKIFGITLLKADLPLPAVHAEWRIAASTPEPAAPAATSG